MFIAVEAIKLSGIAKLWLLAYSKISSVKILDIISFTSITSKSNMNFFN